LDLEFHISFHKGMNPYVGLETYVNWENCGVVRGSKLTEKEYSKLKPDEQEKCHPFSVDGENWYVKPSIQAKNYIIRHNGDEVPVKEFFTSRLFTQEVLVELDEKVIKPLFKFPETQDGITDMETDELEEHLSDESSD
jgi:hypothetical protein